MKMFMVCVCAQHDTKQIIEQGGGEIDLSSTKLNLNTSGMHARRNSRKQIFLCFK